MSGMNNLEIASLLNEIDHLEINVKLPSHMAVTLGDFDSLYSLLLHGHQEIDQPSDDGKTPLMLAVARNDPRMVSALLLSGANIDIVDNTGESALNMIFRLTGTDPEIIDRFLYQILNQCYSTKQLINRLLEAGCTLYHAAFLKNVKVMEGLWKHGVTDFISKYFKGETALHAAVDSNDPSVVTWFLDKGADINVLDKDGCGPLCIAAAAGNSNIVRLLLQRGADPNAKAFDCELTPLIATFETFNADTNQEYDECAEILLRYGAVPLQKIGDDPTVLDEALNRNSFNRIELLLCYVALQEMKGVKMSEMMLQCNLTKNQHALANLKGYYESCLEKLKTKVFEDITLFDLLLMSDRKFRSYMRKESFCDKVIFFLISGDVYESYVYYNNVLVDRMEKTPRACLENEAMSVIGKVFNSNHNECFILAREVVEYLSKQDLKQLCNL